MPTKEQMESVIRQIEGLRAARYGFLDEEGMLPSDMAELLIPGNEGVPWSGINEGGQAETLWYQVDWDGFSEEQMNDVIERVTSGEDPEFWMDGVDRDADLPTPEEFERLKHEKMDDAAQRPLHEKGVRYKDEPRAIEEALIDQLSEALNGIVVKIEDGENVGNKELNAPYAAISAAEDWRNNKGRVPASYQQALDEAIEQGKYRRKPEGKGPDR